MVGGLISSMLVMHLGPAFLVIDCLYQGCKIQEFR